MVRIYDSHAHYDDAAFDADRDDLLSRLPEQGVGAVIQASTDPDSVRRGLALAEKYSYIRVAAGIHPEVAQKATPAWLDDIRQMSRLPQVCAIGEIGLDYHYEDGCPADKQKDVFRRQIELALERDLPIIVHDRDAHEDTMNILTEYRPKGVVHCFSGSVEMMRDIVELGMYIGLGGVTTFKNARRPVAVAAAVPGDRLLLETDAPYMAPEPCRGKRNDSALIAHTAQRIAQLRDVAAEELMDMAWNNACRLFGWPEQK